MNSAARKRSLSERRASGHYLAPLIIPPCDDSEPVKPVVNKADMAYKSKVIEEGQALFKEFVLEQIQKEESVDLEDEYLMSLALNYKNPVWAAAGYDLRQMADQFARTRSRQEVRVRAEQMEVDVSQNQFRDLLSQLFAEGGVTSERIIVLFYFCSDVAVRALRGGRQLFFQFINWSLNFVTEHVCQWVYSQGGWGQVLKSSVNSPYKIVFWAGVSVAIILIIRYYKSKNLIN